MLWIWLYRLIYNTSISYILSKYLTWYYDLLYLLNVDVQYLNSSCTYAIISFSFIRQSYINGTNLATGYGIFCNDLEFGQLHV